MAFKELGSYSPHSSFEPRYRSTVDDCPSQWGIMATDQSLYLVMMLILRIHGPTYLSASQYLRPESIALRRICDIRTLY